MPFFFEMYRIGKNLVYYQLFILLVVSCSMNMNHLYSGMTTLSIENYLNTRHTLYSVGSIFSSIVPGERYKANTNQPFLDPKLNQNFRTFYTFL